MSMTPILADIGGESETFDKYATTKSNGQLFLQGGLLADTVWDIFVLATGHVVASPAVYYTVWILDMVALLFEVIGAVLALILSLYSPRILRVRRVDEEAGKDDDDNDPNANEVGRSSRPVMYINDVMTVLTFFLFIIVAIKNVIKGNSFYQEDCVLPDLN